jgi:hypothetical protein
VGWFPKLDLRSVHFNSLQSLTLGQFIFSHDWQFDWIVSHGPTLRALYLDHCSILHQIGYAHTNGLDSEGYFAYDETMDWPRSPAVDPAHDAEWPIFVNYEIRWHEVFDRFSRELPELHTFKFGTSRSWVFFSEREYDKDEEMPDLPCENRYDDGGGMPIMPWESETDMKNEIFAARYLHYNDSNDEYGVNWDEDMYVSWNNERYTAGKQGPPGCEDEDKAALQNLLRKIGC